MPTPISSRRAGWSLIVRLTALALLLSILTAFADPPAGAGGRFIPDLPEVGDPIGPIGEVVLPGRRACDPKADVGVSPRISHREDTFTLAVTEFGDDDLVDIVLRKYSEDASGNAFSAESRPSVAVWYTFDPARLDERGRLQRTFSPQNPEAPLRLTKHVASPLSPAMAVDTLPEGRYEVTATNRATGCEVKGWFMALGAPTLALSQDFGPVGNPITDPPLTLRGQAFRPDSEVTISVRNAAGEAREIGRERTGGQGEFHVHNLFLNGAAAFGVRGWAEVIVAGPGGHRATVPYLVVHPGMHIVVDGETGHEPSGDHLSILEVRGYGFAPNERQIIEIHTRGAAAGAGPVARFTRSSDRNGLLHHDIGERDWHVNDRATGEYELRIPAKGLSADFELLRHTATIDVEVTGIEVTQGIQDMDNSVPLIARKDTTVRVYVRSDRAPVEGVVCFLSATDEAGRTLTVATGDPENPLASAIRADERVIATPGGSLRGNLATTFNFMLPFDWYQNVGRLTFKARVYAQTNDPDVANNERLETVFFRPTNGVNVSQIRLHTHDPRQLPASDWDDPDNVVRFDRYNQMWDGLGIYPLSRRDYRIFKSPDLLYPLAHFSLPFDGPHVGDEYDNDLRDCEVRAIVARLNWYDMWTDDPDDLLMGPHYWVALYRNTEQACDLASTSAGPHTQDLTLGMVEGVAIVEYNPGNKTYFANQAAETFAHEVGHLIGLRHIDCGDPDDTDGNWPYRSTSVIGDTSERGAWGLFRRRVNGRDTLEVVEPDKARDLMAYCSPEWISDYTYKRVHRLLNPFIEDWIAARDRGDDTPYPAYHMQRALGFRAKSGGPGAAGDEGGSGAGAEKRAPSATAPGERLQRLVRQPRVDLDAIRALRAARPSSLNALFAPADSADSGRWLVAMQGSYAAKSRRVELHRVHLQQTDRASGKYLTSEPFKSALRVTASAGDRQEEWRLPLSRLSETGDQYSFLTVKALDFKPERLEVRDAWGQVLASRKSGGVAPTARWSGFPKGRFKGKGRLSVQATDGDGDSLSVSFQMSRDQGGSWLALPVPSPRGDNGTYTATLNRTSLPGSDNLLIRALVSDGVHTTVLDAPNALITPNHPPVLSLVDPVGAFVGRPGGRVPRSVPARRGLALQVLAEDMEEGRVADAAIIWHSDRGGFLGNGAILHPVLVPGDHVITVAARDRDGGKATLRFTVRVATD